jgi:uncharacterized protein YecT (DUF1311 family)
MNAFLVVLLVAAAEQLDCYHAKTMTATRLCGDAARQAETAMNDAYQEALRKFGHEQAEEQKSFAAAQRNWLNYRRTYCTALSQHWGTGSIRDAYYLACMKDRAERRTAELSEYPERAQGEQQQPQEPVAQQPPAQDPAPQGAPSPEPAQ